MKNFVFHSQIYLDSSDKFTIKLTTNKNGQMGMFSVILQQSLNKINLWSDCRE